jgi:hypothetical protein
MKESHHEIMMLKHTNEELLQKETEYLDKVSRIIFFFNYVKIHMLEFEKNEKQSLVEGEKNMASEFKKKYEDLSKQHRGLMNDFENMIKENADLKKANLELNEYASSVSERIDLIEKDKQDAIRRINDQALEHSSEIKEKVIREKNAMIEQLHNKLKMYERDLKEIFYKNSKLEESCNKLQEVLQFFSYIYL